VTPTQRRLRAAATRARRADLAAKVAREELKQAAVAASEEGLSIRAIGEAIGMSSSGVFELLGRRKR